MLVYPSNYLNLFVGSGICHAIPKESPTISLRSRGPKGQVRHSQFPVNSANPMLVLRKLTIPTIGAIVLAGCVKDFERPATTAPTVSELVSAIEKYGILSVNSTVYQRAADRNDEAERVVFLQALMRKMHPVQHRDNAVLARKDAQRIVIIIGDESEPMTLRIGPGKSASDIDVFLEPDSWFEIPNQSFADLKQHLLSWRETPGPSSNRSKGKGVVN